MENKIEEEIIEETNDEVVENTTENIMYIYVGPRIKQGLFTKGKLIDSSFRDKLKTEIEKCPNLAKLFIDVNKYHELLPKIEDSNSKYQKFIKEVLSNVI